MKPIEGMWDLPVTESELPFYVFPSKKRMGKLPVIEIKGDRKRFLKWLEQHREIDRRVPPAFTEFVVITKDYMVDCHYNDPLNKIYVRVWIDDKIILTACADYETINEDMMDFAALPTAHGAQKFPPVGLRLLAGEAIVNALGVQAYMLYHKPEIVEQVYIPGENRKTNTSRKRVTQQPIKIRKTKIRRIVLTEQDKPQREIHYNKLSWYVRGHYKHVGKDKHLAYIQPSVHTRGGKKYSVKSQTYELTED